MLSRLLLLFAAVSFLAGAATTVLDVVLRGVAAGNLPGAIELTTLSIGLGALLSIPVCYRKNTHVAAHLLSEFNPITFRRPLRLLGTVFSLIFAGTLATIMALYAVEKWGGLETTSDMQLPLDILLTIAALAFVAALVAAVARLADVLRGVSSDG